MFLLGRILFLGLCVSLSSSCLFSSDKKSPGSSPESLTPSTGTTPALFSAHETEEDITSIILPEASVDIVHHNRVPTLSRSHTDGDLYKTSRTYSRQSSPPPEPYNFYKAYELTKLQQDAVDDAESACSVPIPTESNAPTRAQTPSTTRTPSPTPKDPQDQKIDEIKQNLLILALAYEGYPKEGKDPFHVSYKDPFYVSYKDPQNFLSCSGYQKDKSITSHNYSLIKNESKKTAYIAFAGTNFRNRLVAIGSCSLWDRHQFDSASHAVLPSFISYITEKPYTRAIQLACFTSTLCLTISGLILGYSIITRDFFDTNKISAQIALSVFGFASLVPWFLLSNNSIPKHYEKLYVDHIIMLVEEIRPIYAKLKEEGYSVSFVGHSLGGHFAQIFAAFFKGSKAHSISSPGGAYRQMYNVFGHTRSHFNWKEDVPEKEEWENNIQVHAVDGDPITELRCKHDITHKSIELHENFKSKTGVDLHRIKNIYLMEYTKFHDLLSEQSIKKGSVSE